MKRWIRYSRNPEERVMLVSTKRSSLVNCLNCGRWLRVLAVNGKTEGKSKDLFLRTAEGLSRPIWPPKGYDFPGIALKEGFNVFEFIVDSKNPESLAYRIGIDCIVLEKEK